MVDEMFRDVEEAMREDKLKSFWRKWRFVIIGSLLAIVVFVIGNEFYKGKRDKQLKARSAQWQAVLATPESERVQKMDEFIAQESDDYAIFALLYQARAKSDSNKDDALALYNKVISDGKPIYSGLARIEAAVIHMGDKNYGEAGQMLEPLLQPDMPFRDVALYYAAIAALYQQNYPTAQALTQSIIDNPEFSIDLRDLAREINDRALLQSGQ
ncbi:MAG: tetratricopeptide repeat protein [Alphaproteobacteria bacterium]|nr:tetratricopeptide repeat protein [Alphaproteobacteria bacterium]